MSNTRSFEKYETVKEIQAAVIRVTLELVTSQLKMVTRVSKHGRLITYVPVKMPRLKKVIPSLGDGAIKDKTNAQTVNRI
jgi:hypothetical protein